MDMTVIALYFVFVCVIAALAHNRGRGPWRWGLLSVAFSPLAAVVALLIVGYSARCRFCGSGIPQDVGVCRVCRMSLSGSV